MAGKLIALILATIIFGLLLNSGLARAACSDPSQTIMKLYSVTNSHGALWDDATYTYEICYDDIFGRLYTNSGPHTCDGSNKVAGLFDIVNAHAEGPALGNFGTDVCYGNLECTLRDIRCNVDENMTLALFQDTNSHISDPNYMPSGMVSWWRLDEAAAAGATTAEDYLASNDGTLINMEPANDRILGKSGNSLDFDGINEYVEIPDDPGLRPANMITVEAWIMPYSTTFGRAVVKKADANSGYVLEFGINTVRFFIYGGGAWRMSNEEPVTTGNWQHVVGVFDGSNLLTCINGVCGTPVGYSGTIDSSTAMLNIGRDPSNPGDSSRHFLGQIDEVAIYDQALTPQEILRRYNMGMYEKKICCHSDPLFVPEPTVTIDYDGNLGPLFGPHTFGPSELTYTYPVTYTATASDNSGTGIIAVRIFVDGALKQTCVSSPCIWTEPAGYSSGQAVSFYAEADDNEPISGTGSSAAGGFTVCSLDSASVDDSACTGPGGTCGQGDQITVTATFSGDTCPSGAEPLFAQIDADSGTGCTVEAALGAGDMVGIGSSINKVTYQGTWVVPAIPIECRGETVLPTDATLREDLDPTEPWLFFGYEASPSGSVTFADISISLSTVPDPLYVRRGDTVTLFSTADGGGVNIQLQCGESSDTEGNGYADNGGQICTTNNYAPNNPSCSFINDWSENEAKMIYCRVFDGSSYSVQVAKQVFSDNLAPIVTWNTPADPSYFKDGDTISISADITDPDLDDGSSGSGISDGVACTPLMDNLPLGFSETLAVTYSSITSTSGTCSGTLLLDNPSNLKDGNHLLTLEIRDNLGNGDLFGDWKFDEGAGSTAGDSSSHNNDGNLMNGLDVSGWRFGASCISGNCLDFDGTNDYVIINSDDFRTPGSTWSAWIKRGPLSTRYFLGYATSTSDRFLVNADSGNLIFYDDIQNEGQSNTIATNVFQVGEWHYVTILFHEGGSKSAYVDGVLVGQDSDGYNLSHINAGADFYVGSQIGGNNPFDGTIDEVKIYSHVVSPRSIFIDNTWPVCAPNQPGTDVAGTYWSPGTFNLTWTVTDQSGGGPGSGVGIYNVSYARNMPGGSWYDAYASGYEIASLPASCKETSPSIWVCTLKVGDPTELNNHRDYYDFRCNITDKAGNSGPNSAAVSTRIDSVPPDSVIHSPLRKWVNSTSISEIVVKVNMTSTDGNPALADSGVNCSYFKIQRCDHIASPGITACSSWGEWFYGTDHLSGGQSKCMAAATCTGGECNDTFYFDGNGFTPTGTPVVHPLQALEIYNFTLWAKDIAGNIEQHDVTDPIIDPIKPRYKINVTVQKSAGGTEILQGNGIYNPGEITSVRLGSYAWDNESGINTTTLEYTILDDTGPTQGTVNAYNGEEFCDWNGDINNVPACVNETSTGWIPFTSNTIYIRYNIFARDQAGNVNTTSSVVKWFYITVYSLANFKTHNVHLSLGQSYDLALQVRNLQTEFDNITIDLSGYGLACFLNTTNGNKKDCYQMEVPLNPFEEKTVFVRIMASEVSETAQALGMTATSSINNAINTDMVSITIGYPAEFPGLSEWAVIALILISFLVYLILSTRNSFGQCRGVGLA